MHPDFVESFLLVDAWSRAGKYDGLAMRNSNGACHTVDVVSAFPGI